jgi:hypothetical protein
MPRNININQLSTKLAIPRSDTALIKGRIQERSSPEYQIAIGEKILQRQDGIAPTRRDASLNLSAFNMLSSLGVTLSSEKKTYSLIGDQTDTQTIENISIFDPIYNTLTNTPVEAIDKFSNNADPFYELDDSPPSDEMRRREQIIEDELTPDVVSITAELIRDNLNDSTMSTLKQFVNERDMITTEITTEIITERKFT